MEATDLMGRTALHHAAKCGEVEACRCGTVGVTIDGVVLFLAPCYGDFLPATYIAETRPPVLHDVSIALRYI